MTVLPPDQARMWEQKSIQAGARVKDLMRQAVAGSLLELQPFLPKSGTALILIGPGHNGDDAMLLGLELKDLGWTVEFLLSRSPGRRLHPDPRVKPKHWKKALVWPARPPTFAKTRGFRLVVDGILGLGSTPPPRPAEASLLSWIAKEKRGADLFVALDLPSGLPPASGPATNPIFPADLTLALGSVKIGCLHDSSLPFVGRLRGVPIDFGTPAPSSVADFFLPTDATLLLRPRSANLHKHSAGTVHLWAGSSEYPGAALLSSLGALRSGAGYVRLFTDRSCVAPLSPSLPELLLHGLETNQSPDPDQFLKNATALVIGPGLPPSPQLADFLQQILPIARVPLVLDAGALSIIADHPEWLLTAAGRVLLTPHAGEFSRLISTPITERATAALAWLTRFPSTVLIAKGPHTLIASSGQPLSANGSGGPEQATAGMGDLLSGLIGGLLASGYPPFDAARLAVSWHGLAADLAARQGGPSVLATEVANQLPLAWRNLSFGATSDSQ